MMNSGDLRATSRRAFLRRAALAAGAGAAFPLLGAAGGATASPAWPHPTNPDELFRAGRFAEAERGYLRILRRDPQSAHASAQLGYLALLSNRFQDAEQYLAAATRLAPDDVASKQRLAECFVRQDQHARAVPLLRATGSARDDALATQYAHLTGTPWQVHGAPSARVPFLGLDPLPSVEASINGGPVKGYMLDTYGTLGMSLEVAEEAGLHAVSTISGSVGGQVGDGPTTMYLGVVDSFRIGDIEVRNVPVHWMDARRLPLPDGLPSAGVIGTTLFYHLLTTIDFAGQALVLRRKTEPQLREARREAARTGFDRMPLWLAGDHYPCSWGSLGDYGPRIVTLDSGGSNSGVGTTVEIAELAGIEVDYDHPVENNGGTSYPIAPDISLGRAVGQEVNGYAHEERSFGPGPAQSDEFGFEVIANFSHGYFRPFAATFDYANMHLYMAGKPGHR